MPRYELVEGTSSKFWDIEQAGAKLTVKFGKIGSNGQTQLKELGSAAEAKKEFDRLVAEKTKKGYQLAGGATATKSVKAKAAPAGGMYFEFVEGSSSKFWEITLDGTTVTTRYGKIGSDGQSTTKTHTSASDARAEHDKLVAEKTKKGYELVRGEAPTAPEAKRDAKLEAAIAADVDDPAAYLVYADWLQQHGDPRGELIVLQHAGKTAAANKLIASNAATFWGPLAEHLAMTVPVKFVPFGEGTQWRWGFLERLWIGRQEYESDEPSVTETLGKMLEHPSARFLRELSVGMVSFEGNSYETVATVIGEHPVPTLRKLVLGDFYYEQTELNWSTIGKLEPLYKGVRNLEVLVLRSGSMKLGAIDLPKLRELRVISGGLDKASLAAICAAKWPVLEVLSLQLGRDGKFTTKELQPIFDGKGFAKVTALGLGNSTISDEICKALAGSKIAAQLVSLDLSLGTMGDEGAAALAAGSFPRLATLDVSGNYLTKRGLAALKSVAKTVVSNTVRRGEAQRDDGGNPEDRYIGAYE